MKRLVVSVLTVALLAVLVGSTASAATPRCKGVKATIVGNDKANLIRGTNKRDVIVAKGGADKIYGRGGNDIICAGKGKDLVIAGAGDDKVFGQDGSDKLKGGAGFDLLNGGPKADGCYLNADSGNTVNCEEADLQVTVEGPASVENGQTIEHKVRVKNIGGKPAPGVKLSRTYLRTNVSCTLDFTGIDTVGWLKPGAKWFGTYWQPCYLAPGTPNTVTMGATATTNVSEEDPTNNEDVSTTTVLP